MMGTIQNRFWQPGLGLLTLLLFTTVTWSVDIQRNADGVSLDLLGKAALADDGDGGDGDGGDGDGGDGDGDGGDGDGDGGDGDGAGDGGDDGGADASGQGDSSHGGASSRSRSRSQEWRKADIRKLWRIIRPIRRQPARRGFRPPILGINLTPAEIRQITTREGLRLLNERRFNALAIRYARFAVPQRLSAQRTLVRLRRLYGQNRFTFNHVYRLATDGCQGQRCYARRMIGWSKAPATCGVGLRIGILDTGVNLQAPALRGQKITTETFRQQRGRGGRAHGTAIASVLVGRHGDGFAGMLPGAHLYAANVFSRGRGGITTSAINIVRGLDWLVAQRVSIVNASLAGPENALVSLAVAVTRQRGIVVVAAAGNGGKKGPPAFPAADRGVIAVTAVDRFRRSYRRATRGAYIAYAAPGVRIWTPRSQGRGAYSSGSSMASAFVTGILGQKLGRKGGASVAGSSAVRPSVAKPATAAWQPRDIRTLLAGSVIDLGAPGRDPVFGWGLIRSKPDCR